MRVPKKIIRVEDFEQYTGPETVERIIRKAKQFRDMHVVHVNSTYYGGGVAEVLSSKTLLMNSLGIKTGWRVIQGSPDFFSITKKVHNALQGGEINLSDLKVQTYEDVIWENAMRTHFDHDFVIVHDPQPLGMVQHYRRKAPWIWRCQGLMSRSLSLTSMAAILNEPKDRGQRPEDRCQKNRPRLFSFSLPPDSQGALRPRESVRA